MLQNLHYEVEILLSPTIAPVYMAAQNVILPLTNMTTTYLCNADYNTITNYGYNFIRFISQYFD